MRKSTTKIRHWSECKWQSQIGYVWNNLVVTEVAWVTSSPAPSLSLLAVELELLLGTKAILWAKWLHTLYMEMDILTW